jgi:hypothetical protein
MRDIVIVISGEFLLKSAKRTQRQPEGRKSRPRGFQAKKIRRSFKTKRRFPEEGQRCKQLIVTPA